MFLSEHYLDQNNINKTCLMKENCHMCRNYYSVQIDDDRLSMFQKILEEITNADTGAHHGLQQAFE